MNAPAQDPHISRAAAEARRQVEGVLSTLRTIYPRQNSYRACASWREWVETLVQPDHEERADEPEPGEWSHGWQFSFGNAIEKRFQYQFLATLPENERALMHSQAHVMQLCHVFV